MRAIRPRRRGKYGAIPTVIDGIRFHSKREGARYRELRLLERAGEIRDLQRQYALHLLAPELGPKALENVNGVRVRGVRPLYIYRADFVYRTRSGALVFEDVKGYDSPVSKLKRRHAEAQYGIQIQVVR